MLSLQDVSHVYPNGTRALDGVSLAVPRGMYGLLGPNGAGKSTLMRTIATLQTPTAGTIRFGDIDVIGEPERWARSAEALSPATIARVSITNVLPSQWPRLCPVQVRTPAGQRSAGPTGTMRVAITSSWRTTKPGDWKMRRGMPAA